MNDLKTTLADCRLVQLPRFDDERGTLGVIENNVNIPFEIQRVYFLHSITKGVVRGEHAHKELSQLIIAASGTFQIEISDGRNSHLIKLKNPHEGLFLCPMIWRRLFNFSEGAVCMVFASHLYDQQDYIHDFELYKLLKGLS